MPGQHLQLTFIFRDIVAADSMMGAGGPGGFRGGRGAGGFRGRGGSPGRFAGRSMGRGMGGRGMPAEVGARDPRSLVSYVDVDAPKVNLGRWLLLCMLSYWRGTGQGSARR